jgi:hypothetical protein
MEKAQQLLTENTLIFEVLNTDFIKLNSAADADKAVALLNEKLDLKC